MVFMEIKVFLIGHEGLLWEKMKKRGFPFPLLLHFPLLVLETLRLLLG